MTDRKITLHGVSVATTAIQTTEGEYAEAVEHYRLDLDYDVWLSDMSRTTVIIDHEGRVRSPYDDPDAEVDLIEILEPVLRHVPTWKVEQYAAQRRMEEE